MQLALTPEEAAFRDELRTFYTTQIPAEIRERNRLGLPLGKEGVVTAHKILHEHGLAVPNWPVEWGGKDWTPTQHQIWLDEMQLAGVPEPLTFNARMVGPVIAEFGSQALKERFQIKPASPAEYSQMPAGLNVCYGFPSQTHEFTSIERLLQVHHID